MSAGTIKEFLVGLGFDVDEAGLSKFTGAIASATGVALAMGAAVTAAVGAVLHGVKEVASEYDALDKLATRFHTTADAVDEFQDVAQVLGLTKEQSIGSLTALDKAVNDTALGLGRAKLIFEEIGLSVTDAAGKVKPTTQVFDELAVKLQGFERGKQIRIMERLGLDPALLKLFSADLGAIKADLEAIDKAAGFDLGEAVTQSKAFMKTWKAMQQEWQKVSIVASKFYESIAVRLMPALRVMVDDFRKRLEQMRKYVMENFGGIRDAVASAVEFIVMIFSGMWRLLGRVFDAIMDGVDRVVKAFKTMPPELQIVAQAALGLAAAWAILNTGILASPIFWIIALSVALLALWDDYQTWKEDGESLINWGEWTEEIAIVQAAFGAFADFLNNAFLLLYASVDTLAKLLAGDFRGAWAAVQVGVEAIIGVFKTAFDWVTKLIDAVARFGGFKDSITDTIGALGKKIGTTIGLDMAAAGQAQAATGQFDASGNPLAASGGVPVPGAPAPVVAADAARSANVQQNVNQQTTIQVTGGADPASTGRAVAGEQDRVNATMTRDMKGSVR